MHLGGGVGGVCTVHWAGGGVHWAGGGGWGFRRKNILLLVTSLSFDPFLVKGKRLH